MGHAKHAVVVLKTSSDDEGPRAWDQRAVRFLRGLVGDDEIMVLAPDAEVPRVAAILYAELTKPSKTSKMRFVSTWCVCPCNTVT